MQIRKGTNRIVLVFKNHVIKIGIGRRGYLANYIEWVNYLNNKEIVAETKFKCGILKQERLFNIQRFLYDATIDEIPQEIKHLYKYCLHSRMQVGQDKNGKWKYYDYEDTKYYFRKEYMSKERRK